MLKKFFQRTTTEHVPDLSGLLEKQYIHQVAQNHIQHDNAQFIALQHLQTLLDNILLSIDYDQKSVAHKLLSSPPEKCQSLYIFGDVGRGKSMLMALFYEACPIKQKRRVHFNMFMLEVHVFIHEWRQQNNTDAISALAKKIRASALLLCLDEFHVTDIADAMILERLFSKLFESGIIVVITSNRHPDDLYLGGLQREQFLIFTRLLQRKSKVIELVAKEDYRLMHLHALEATYYFPLDAHAGEFVQQSYNEFTNFAPKQAGVLQVLGRKVILSAVHGDIALTSFDELCVQSLGSADYIEIAREFSTVIMAEIPKLSAEKRNEAKRFMNLIDALYEHKVKLICTAEVPAQELYTEGDGAFEFRRTASRLIEMQSEGYLQSTHIGHL
ncbi:MAG: cell division protein ZapE [Methylococcaceae bacterium]|nr:cell division protein ZapE [Methylococcaceae bacterium]